MKQLVRIIVVIAVVIATSSLLPMPSAWAVPSYTHRYGVDCYTCHTVWGAITPAGLTFKLSGYRAIFGKDLKPLAPDQELANGMLVIPGTLPLSLITGFGYDYRNEKRRAADGTSTSRTASSLDLEDASIFLTAPLGKSLSCFIEFPMYETKAWEFTPTGPAEANDHNKTRTFHFDSETPVFEVAKFFVNNLIPDTPRDSVTFQFGISHPPLAYSSGKVRLSYNQYLVYERRALDLLVGSHGDSLKDTLHLSSDQEVRLFRLSEPQVFFEVMGMLAPGKEVTDVSKKDTLWLEYHLGVTNGSNGNSDNNSQKDVYGRLAARYYGQSLGVFGYYSADTYDDGLRTDVHNSTIAGGRSIFSGLQAHNSLTKIGPDMTLSLVPFGIPVWLENQLLYSRETNPTGYHKSFTWWGGFDQLNWRITKPAVTYVRYDWINGKLFDDTTTAQNGFSGLTKVKPGEWDVVAGVQYLVLQNVKLVGEYRHHVFTDKASSPNTARLTDDGFTTRVMIGL